MLTRHYDKTRLITESCRFYKLRICLQHYTFIPNSINISKEVTLFNVKHNIVMSNAQYNFDFQLKDLYNII